MKNTSSGSEWDSLKELDALQNRLRALFAGSSEAVEGSPALALSDDGEAFHITVDLAGRKKADIKVTVEDGHVILSGEADGSAPCQNAGYARYVRSFQFPAEVEEDGIEADFRDGVLHIRLPRGAGATGANPGGRRVVPVK